MISVAIAPTQLDAVVHGKPGASESRVRAVQDAVTSAGARVAAPSDAEALIWLEVGDPAPLAGMLDAYPNIQWVQLSWAGVDPLVGSGLFKRDVVFTCAKGLYGPETAEQAMALMLAGVRHLGQAARHQQWNWLDPQSLYGKRVTILGAGDTATNLIKLLAPFGCHISVLRRGSQPVEGAIHTGTLDDLSHLLPDTDVLVLALSLTDATKGIIGHRELALLPPTASLINVARGGHVDTDALVKALQTGELAFAGLDVTNPEPLPSSHPLWALDNVIIASHSANGVDFSTRALAQRVCKNVAARASGEPLEGLVDPTVGY